MALSQPKFLDIPFANSSNQRTDNIPNNDTTGVGNASWEQGFPPETMIQIADGGVPPRGQDMNGILNQICKILQYVQTGTLFQYNSAFANSTNVNGYPKGALVLSTDKVTLWRNTVEGNKTNPDSGGAGWVNFLADLGLYLPLAGGTMTGQIKSTYASIPISFINLGSGVYRDIQALRSDVGNGYRLGCVRFATTSTTNVMTFGASDGINSAPSGVQVTREIGDGVTAGAVTVTVATTPAVSDDSKQVATTGYVKDCLPVSIGSGVKPTYTNASGVLTASSSTVGSATKPIYLNAGTLTSCSSSLTDYLPLAGGTMTGAIVSSIQGLIKRNNNTGTLVFSGGSDTTYSSKSGALLTLYGSSQDGADAGAFRLTAMASGGTYKELKGLPNGTLNWDSNPVITGVKHYETSINLDVSSSINIDSNASSGNNKESWRYFIGKNSAQTTNDGSFMQMGVQQIASSRDLLVGFRVGNPRSGNLPSAATGVNSGNEWGGIYLKYYYDKNYAFGYLLNTPTLDTSSAIYSAQHIATVGNLKTALGAYLPLAGGTMTGTIVSSINDIIKRNNDTNVIRINGGSAYENGASLSVFGKSNASNAGIFTLRANNGTNSCNLNGTPAGALTWGGNNVLTAANYSNYALPLAGGAMTGTEITRSVDNSFIRISGGTSYNAKGASLWLHGKDQADYLGQFRLRSSDGTNTKTLIGKPDGTLSWDGSVYLSSDGVYGVDLTGQTIDLNTCYSTISGAVKLFHCNTDGGSNNISNCPENKAFILVSFSPRRLNASDYVLRQDFYCIGAHYFRRCTNGTWTDWHLEVGASSASVGDSNTPVYLNNGVVTSTEKSFASYLPLAGGTMTGDIQFSGGKAIKASTDSSTMNLYGGTAYNTGAYCWCRGKDHSTEPGWFKLAAVGTVSSNLQTRELVGKPDGTLTWAASNIYVANKTNISTVGGAITRSGTLNWLRFTGGETDYTDGASIILFGKAHSSNAGVFTLSAYDGTNRYNLSGNPANGRMSWNGTFYNLNAENLFKVTGVTNNIGNGALITGTDANYGIQLQSTGITKGTTNSTTYRGTVEWYGNTRSKWQDRLGMLEFSAVSNKSQAALVAYNITSAENTGTSYIRAIVDASGNAYTETLTPSTGDNSTKIATTAWVTTAVTKGANMPPGTIVEFAGTSAPSGWLYCNGAAVSRTTYTALFSAIGTGYGAGNGSSTFNLPDFRNRVPQGGSSATDRGNIAAGLPNITGKSHAGKGGSGFDYETEGGAFRLESSSSSNSGEGNKWQGSIENFDASRCSSIYGNSTTVQPPAVKVMFIIKT